MRSYVCEVGRAIVRMRSCVYVRDCAYMRGCMLVRVEGDMRGFAYGGCELACGVNSCVSLCVCERVVCTCVLACVYVSACVHYVRKRESCVRVDTYGRVCVICVRVCVGDCARLRVHNACICVACTCGWLRMFVHNACVCVRGWADIRMCMRYMCVLYA